ncbi:helix-turn-helix transcriptional regulator [uncultured Roseobacter sp.]|uniref:helix-turn-helix domain-containing protein n=1 Tax=uncultured Roseobacter sp. TaxID=114847 RepID=UPI00262E8404|nr:helix-turn-helix transcriptional regulator [uncultured Roseobacter sp.]
MHFLIDEFMHVVHLSFMNCSQKMCGPRLLGQYLSETDARQEDFAPRVGLSQSAISRLMTGRTKVSLELAFEIEKITKGAVPAKSWVGSPDRDVSGAALAERGGDTSEATA